MACTAVGRYLPLSGCLGIIVEAVNLKTRLAFTRAPLIRVTPYRLRLLSLATDNKMRKRSILTVQSNDCSFHLTGGQQKPRERRLAMGWIAREGCRLILVGFFFFGLLGKSNISVPFMLLIYVEACSCKISISEKGAIFRYYVSLFSPLRSSKVKKKKSVSGTFSLPQQPIQRAVHITRDYSLLFPVCRNAVYSLSSTSETHRGGGTEPIGWAREGAGKGEERSWKRARPGRNTGMAYNYTGKRRAFVKRAGLQARERRQNTCSSPGSSRTQPLRKDLLIGG